jgi:uncharacterized protein YcbK (DUF882 family)
MNRNEKIQTNFTLNEFVRVYGVPQAEEINWKYITDAEIDTIKTRLAPFCQDLRNHLNSQFAHENGGQIGVRVICGFRAKMWEISQGRSGASRHTNADAIDITFTGCKNDQMYMKIFYYVAYMYAQHPDGFACKYPTFSGGKIQTYGFIHIDFRGSLARWNY